MVVPLNQLVCLVSKQGSKANVVQRDRPRQEYMQMMMMISSQMCAGEDPRGLRNKTHNGKGDAGVTMWLVWWSWYGRNSGSSGGS